MPPKHRQKKLVRGYSLWRYWQWTTKTYLYWNSEWQWCYKTIETSSVPQEIADKIDYLAAQTEQLKQTVKEKDEKIKQLESRVDLLESANDSIEQYSRRSNLRIEGIPESVGICEIENAILDIVNDHMKLTSVLQSQRDWASAQNWPP